MGGEFYGRIDRLGRDRQGNTIIGESLYYDDKREYELDIKDMNNDGDPHISKLITKEEFIQYKNSLHEECLQNDEKSQEKISFPDSEKEINEIIDDSNMDQRKIEYYEDKIKNNDCLIVKDLFYSVITKSAKNEGYYQRTEYMDKDLTRLCDDTQYKNIREVAKALTLSKSDIFKEYKLKDDVKKIDNSICAIHIYEDKKIKNKNKFFIGKPINKFIERISELAAIDKIKQKFKEIKNDKKKDLKNDLNEKKGLKL